jgi:hypothetical protein
MWSALWRKDGSIVHNCRWPSPAQSFLGPSPTGLATIFYYLKFETSSFVTSYDSQGEVFDLAREKVSQYSTKRNVRLSPSDDLYPRIDLQGNVFTKPLLSSRWLLNCDLLACRGYVAVNGARTNGRLSCRGQSWLDSTWFNVGGSHIVLMCFLYPVFTCIVFMLRLS